MSKLFRAASTVVIAVGLAYLFMYVQSQNIDKLSILEQPSYYVTRSLWFMFVAGVVVIVFGVLGSFFSWFKKMNPQNETLPNAGYVSDKEIRNWVGGEADGAEDVDKIVPVNVPHQETEVLDKSTEIVTEPTEVISEKNSDIMTTIGETEVLSREDEL